MVKINEEFEKIREELGIKFFIERFEISEEIAKFMRENPDAKLAELRAEDFTQNPELQSDWENILEDVLKGIELEKGMQSKKFDWKNPKESFKKIGKVGEEAWEQIKTHPLLAAGLLIAGTAFVINLFKKEKGFFDWVKTGLSGGLATWLALSIFKEDCDNDPKKQSIPEKIARVALGDQIVNNTKETYEKMKNFINPEKEKEFLGGYTPNLSKFIRSFSESAERNDSAEMKEHFGKLYAAAQNENARIAVETKKDGGFNIYLIPKGVAKVFSFSWKLTDAVVSDFGTFLARSESPWWRSGGAIIDLNSWIPATGAAVGTITSISSLLVRPTINPLKIIGRVGAGTTKGAFKGSTVGVYRGTKVILSARNWNEMVRYHRTAFELAKLNFLENFGGKQLRCLKNPAKFIYEYPRKIAKKAYYLKRARLLSELEAHAGWTGKKKLEAIQKAIKETKSLAKAKVGVTTKQFERAIRKGEKQVFKKSAERIAKRTARKTAVKETLKKSVSKLRHLKVLRQKLTAITTKVRVPKEALKQIVKLLPKPVQIAVAGAASLGTMTITAIIWDALFPEKAGAANEAELLKRSSILHQEFSQQKLPVEYVWWVSRGDRKDKLSKLDESQKLKIIEAIHATNARIKEELPGTPLFEIPPELETKN
ncbi:hypothetical protein KKF38_00610 [Patescibacteria group bacterium]|nr:hypothetical protein [Patescibacteria group bacterium]